MVHIQTLATPGLYKAIYVALFVNKKYKFAVLADLTIRRFSDLVGCAAVADGVGKSLIR